MGVRQDREAPCEYFQKPNNFSGTPNGATIKVTDGNRGRVGAALMQRAFLYRVRSIWAPRYRTPTEWARAAEVNRDQWAFIWEGRRWLTVAQVGLLVDLHGTAALTEWDTYQRRLAVCAGEQWPPPGAEGASRNPAVRGRLGFVTVDPNRTPNPVPGSITEDDDYPIRLDHGHPAAQRIIQSAEALASKHNAPAPPRDEIWCFQTDPAGGAGASGGDVCLTVAVPDLDPAIGMIDDHAVLDILTRNPDGSPARVTVLDVQINSDLEWPYLAREADVRYDDLTGEPVLG